MLRSPFHDSKCVRAACQWSTRVLVAAVALALTRSVSMGDDELPPAAGRKVQFLTEVRPVLEQHCWSCHGSEKQESGLRLDRGESVAAGGDSGKAIEPGNSAASRLIRYVAGAEPDHMMPPEGDRLSAVQIGLLRAWIDQGAEWPKEADSGSASSAHWAWQPLKIPEIPAVTVANWPVNPIDHFVLAELERRGIDPSPPADRATLIRRLSLDLTGLLPTVDEVDQFVNDSRPAAWDDLVDRLLASPHFGERWGRHWLDLARYADSDGYEKDNPRPDAWRWRDWVIEAINNDLPFDQFTIEQLAGDLLPDATPMQRLATAFHRQTLTNTEGGTDQEEFRVAACFDRTETTGSVWLGLTIGCARCHSHKYDPITQREYYQIFSVFNNGDESTTVVPKPDADVAAWKIARSEYDTKLKDLTERLSTAETQTQPELTAWQEATLASLKQAESEPLKLQPLAEMTFQSDSTAVFEQESGSILRVSGDNPDKVVYTITGTVGPVAGTGIRLDVFPEPSHPAKGPGRSPHGNFVLSELTLEAASKPDFSDARGVPFITAKADYQQNTVWTPENVFDGKDDTGWAIAPEFGKQHWLVPRLREPLNCKETPFLRVRLSQQYGKQHSIARFRLSVQSGFEPTFGIPEEVAKALRSTSQTDAESKLIRDHFLRQHPATRDLLAELEELKKKAPSNPELTVRVISQRTKDPRKTFVLRRGEFLHPIAELEVQPAALAILPALTSRIGDSSADRLDFARWLVSPDNPLTPRVTVNQIWRQLYGQGLVRTPGDFGVRGERPSHPELMDWLATAFMNGSSSGRPWSRKALIRLIVTSATYCQSSRTRPELLESDPLNVLLARQNRLRVEGEIVRDISLQVSGLLSTKIGGPSVYPALPPGIAELSYAGNFKWPESTGDDRFRRGMYTFFKRTSPHPSLMTFDCPDANTTCVSRQTSNTPLQALTSLNNESFSEAARGLTRRILSEVPDSPADQFAIAFRWCVARPGSAAELSQLQSLLQDAERWFSQHPEDAERLAGRDTLPSVSTTRQAAWITVSRILLNLDEFITRE